MPIDLFTKTPIKNELSAELLDIINDLKKCSGKEDCLRQAFEILTKKYRGYRTRTYLKLYEIFTSDVDVLWHRRGFLHCTNMNYLMRTLLVGSGHFRDEELILRWTHIWYLSPHQYMEVKIDNRTMNIDIWSYAFGIKFGDYAHGLHCFYPPENKKS